MEALQDADKRFQALLAFGAQYIEPLPGRKRNANAGGLEVATKAKILGFEIKFRQEKLGECPWKPQKSEEPQPEVRTLLQSGQDCGKVTN